MGACAGVVRSLVRILNLELEGLRKQATNMLMHVQFVHFFVTNSKDILRHAARTHEEEFKYVFDNPMLYLKLVNIPYYGIKTVELLEETVDVMCEQTNLRSIR